MAAPKVLILYNEPILSEDHPAALSEQDVVTAANEVSTILTAAGYRTECLAISEPHGLISALRRRRPDVVFNLFEGIHNRGETEPTAAGILEWLGIPFTG